MDNEKVIPKIDLLPMIQRSEIKTRAEDWTGKSSAAERRKLQNRLNQRAARRRKALIKDCSPECHAAAQRVAQASPLPQTEDGRFEFLLELIKRPDIGRSGICMSHYARQMVVSAPSFEKFLPTTLPVDQKLLTLLHFNLVRGFGQLLCLLGYTIEDMSLDIFSQFSTPGARPHNNLPPALHPTELQRSTVHYAELDVFPYSEYRDNCILAGDEIDDIELCNDILYGVESERETEGWGLDPTGRTGLIVWSDPWRRESWEVDEKFAIKYYRLFKGCKGLIESTNYWRATRGETPLSIVF